MNIWRKKLMKQSSPENSETTEKTIKSNRSYLLKTLAALPKKNCLFVLLGTHLCFLFFGFAAQAQTLPTGSTAKNVAAIGYTDIDGKPAFKISIKEHRGRWYLFAGHFWHRGWSVIDVTNPRAPRLVKFIAGPENTFTGQMELSGDRMITSLEKILPGFGGDEKKQFDEGVIIWDIKDPTNPIRLGQFKTGGSGTHRNFYSGGRHIHLAAGMPGYAGNIYVIVDISDPAKPREVGRWHVKGQHTAGGEKLASSENLNSISLFGASAFQKNQSFVSWTNISESAARDADDNRQDQTHNHGTCGSDADVSLHGPPYVVGNRAYLSYGSAGMIILDISDVSKPREIGRLDFSPPFHSKFGVHGVLPLPEKGIAYANSEDVSYGKGPLHHASIIDISNPAEPMLLSLFPAPLPPDGVSYRDFFAKGGWSGPHNFNHLQHNPAVEKQNELFYFAHFNAGLRIYNVANPRQPVEVGFFMPPEPPQRYGSMPQGKLVLQTEDVLVDRRGYIYITDKNQGIWILKYTGISNRDGRKDA
jgi:hypothetical protein